MKGAAHFRANVVMDAREIIKKILSEDNLDFNIYRSFLGSNPISTLIVRRANDVIENIPETQDTIIALLLYPALKWILNAKEVDCIMGNICYEDEAIEQLKKVQGIIKNTTGISANLLLKKRDAYFGACETLVNLIDKIIDDISTYPYNGLVYSEILTSTISSSPVTVPSKHYVNKYFEDMVYLVSTRYGDQITKVLDEILSGKMQSDDELNYVYHNIDLLMREYTKIVWMARVSNDKALRLLACKTEAEMLEITKKDDTYRQAYVIVEYIKFIRSAVELVKSFPNGDNDYYTILKSLVDVKPGKNNNSVIAKELGMSYYSFSSKKRRALGILSAVLWGCDGDIFVRFLTTVF